MPSGDDKSRLNSRVFPSVRFSSSTRITTPHSTRTTSYKEARKIYADAKVAQKAGQVPGDLAKQKFETALPEVIEGRKPHLAENTIRLRTRALRPTVEALLRPAGFSDRRPGHRTLSGRTGERGIPPHRQLGVQVLRYVLRAAKIWPAIAADYKPLREDRHGPGRAIAENEERLLFDTARSKPGWDAAFYAAMVAANTSARSCEIKGLRLQDVNLVEREVSIQRSKGNTAGVRRIPLNDGALWGFARLLERANALGAVAPDYFRLPRFLYRATKRYHPVVPAMIRHGLKRPGAPPGARW